MLSQPYDNKAVGRLTDRMRECISCGKRWYLTPREAGRHRHQELPKRCARCRESQRLERELDDAA
jgi:hypothetical protein